MRHQIALYDPIFKRVWTGELLEVFVTDAGVKPGDDVEFFEKVLVSTDDGGLQFFYTGRTINTVITQAQGWTEEALDQLSFRQIQRFKVRVTTPGHYFSSTAEVTKQPQYFCDPTSARALIDLKE